MFKRVIPVLLLSGRGLVKTRQFAQPKYVGDPINAVKIFSEKEADELVFLDIDASRQGRQPDLALIKDISSEAYMPFAYGGGVKTVAQAEGILKNGAEKLVLNDLLLTHPELVAEFVLEFGSSALVACVNVKKDAQGVYRLYCYREGKTVAQTLSDHLRRCQDLGVGEVILQSVDEDGSMQGYDTRLISQVRPQVQVPMVALGGAGRLPDLRAALEAGADAAAAGSLFTFYGKYRAVLLTYPSSEEMHEFIG